MTEALFPFGFILTAKRLPNTGIIRKYERKEILEMFFAMFLRSLAFNQHKPVKSSPLHFYLPFLVASYPTALIASTVFDRFVVGGIRPPGIHLFTLPFLALIFFGCLAHMSLAIRSTHDGVRMLVAESRRSSLILAGILSGTFDILCCLLLLSAVSIGLRTVYLLAKVIDMASITVGVILQLCAVTLPASFIPLIVVHYFCSKIDRIQQ
jgi:hypothetical protein